MIPKKNNISTIFVFKVISRRWISESEASLADEPIRTPCICRRRLVNVPEESESDDESVYELEEIETQSSTVTETQNDQNEAQKR